MVQRLVVAGVVRVAVHLQLKVAMAMAPALLKDAHISHPLIILLSLVTDTHTHTHTVQATGSCFILLPLSVSWLSSQSAYDGEADTRSLSLSLSLACLSSCSSMPPSTFHLATYESLFPVARITQTRAFHFLVSSLLFSSSLACELGEDETVAAAE